MSGEFYQVLFYSLLLTGGAVSIYFGYRYLLAKYGTRPPQFKYVTLHNLESGKAKGEIVFYFEVPEDLAIRLELLDKEDQVLKVLEDKDFTAGDHRVKFDSLPFANGDYFYRITTAHQQTTKKFRIEN